MTGRPNQKRRTRKALLEAASALLREGASPTLEEVAERALVSRATAYRYFPNVDSLLVEAALDVAAPQPEELFAAGGTGDPVARLEKVDAAMNEMISANEASLRLMMIHSLQQKDSELPARQNRRSALIEAALAPVKRELKPGAYQMLSRSLALVIGTEAMLALKDVLQLSDEEARKVRRWAIRALVEAAKAT